MLYAIDPQMNPRNIQKAETEHMMCWLRHTHYTCGHKSPIRPAGYNPNPNGIDSEGLLTRDENMHEDTSLSRCCGRSRGESLFHCCFVDKTLEQLPTCQFREGRERCQECVEKNDPDEHEHGGGESKVDEQADVE